MDIESLLKTSYSESKALGSYQSYCREISLDEKSPEFEQTFHSCVPLIRDVYSSSYPHLLQLGDHYYSDQQDVEQECVIHLWYYVSTRAIPAEPSYFTNWLRRTLRYRMIDALKNINWGRPPTEPDRPDLWHQPTQQSAYLHAEVHDILTELPSILMVDVAESSRFTAETEQRALQYVLVCVFRKRKAHLGILRNYYLIKDPDLWVDYVMVKLRKSLYRIRRKYKDQIYNTPTEYSFDRYPDFEPADD